MRNELYEREFSKPLEDAINFKDLLDRANTEIDKQDIVSSFPYLEVFKSEIIRLRNRINDIEVYYSRLEDEYYECLSENEKLEQQVEHYKDMYESLKGILNQKGF